MTQSNKALRGAQGNRKQLIGRRGEAAAEKFLLDHHLVFIGRNIRSSYGELDLVMQQGDEVVFVEVKARTSETFGLPEDAVGSLKQVHLIQSAEAYMQSHPELGSGWRIDVIAVRFVAGEREPRIEWFENAVS